MGKIIIEATAPIAYQPRAHGLGVAKGSGRVGHRQTQCQGIAAHGQHDLNIEHQE